MDAQTIAEVLELKRNPDPLRTDRYLPAMAGVP